MTPVGDQLHLFVLMDLNLKQRDVFSFSKEDIHLFTSLSKTTQARVTFFQIFCNQFGHLGALSVYAFNSTHE